MSSGTSRQLNTPPRHTLATSLVILAATLQCGPSSPRKGARMEGIWACLNRRDARPAPTCGFGPRHFSLAHSDGLHCTERLGDIENSTGDCCCTRAARHSAFGSVTFWRVAGRHCRRSHVSRLEAGAELLGAAGIPQWAAGIAYLLSTHQDAAIEAHFLSNKFTWGLFELLQVLVVDADDQSSSCLQQKLEELSYKGSPQPASLCRSGAMAVSCEQDFNRFVLGPPYAAGSSRELSGRR